MKSINLVQTIIAIFILFSLNSCQQETDFEEVQNKSNFKILPYTNTKTAGYSDNYMVNDNSTIDIANDVINLEIPVPLADYSFLRAYNISTANNAAILYLISRGETNKVVDMPTDYVIQTAVSISELNLDINLIENGNGLRIFVMNNSEELDLNSDTYNCLVDKVDTIDLNANKCGSNKAADGPHTYNGSMIQM